MKFLVDAQLPRSLARAIEEAGYDVIHTLDLPLQNKTSDGIILDICAEQSRIVITKDTDFLDSHLLLHKPEKLVLVTTGNIRNADLLALFSTHLGTITGMLQEANLIEINRTEIISHKG